MRSVEQNLMVTPQTLFAIGSATKPFTTMAMSILAERGLLDWDKPVRNYLPTLKLYDSYATEHITPRDLVTHRSGLPRHDRMLFKSSLTRKEILDRLQYLEPTHELRTVFQYQNLMYMVAGYLVGEIAQSSWEEFVLSEIFNPLEMRTSNFSIEETQKADNFALPYREKDDKVEKMPFCNVDVSDPAGSINSNIVDLANWLLLHLNQGKHGDKQIISPVHLEEMHSPQFVTPQRLQFNEIFHYFYGLGWFISVYRGHNLIQHSGNIDGFAARTTLLPQDNIGIVVLTNLEQNPVIHTVTYYVCDFLLALDESPWNERMRERYAQAKEEKAKAALSIIYARKSGTQPSHPLEDYTGDFENPAYGALSVSINENHLTATYNSTVYKLEHYHYDIFIESELDDKPQLISFLTDIKGNISSVTVPLEPTVKDILFTRITI
ncbi:MAG: serine hydrolase [Rhizonema sp. PD38]|nr:serine hydrolase [Rhizonema sp. PD38]